MGQVGPPGHRACSESALVPRDPSPSAEASLPMASTTPSWPQWRRAPASPAACEWGLRVLKAQGATGSSECMCSGAITGTGTRERQYSAGMGHSCVGGVAKGGGCAAEGEAVPQDAVTVCCSCRGRGCEERVLGMPGAGPWLRSGMHCRREQKHSQWEFPDWIPVAHRWRCLSDRYHGSREGAGPEEMWGRSQQCVR